MNDKNTKIEKVKPFIDYLVDRLISRKFIAFLVATWLVYKGKIDGTEWAFFTGLYVVGIIYLKYLEKMEQKREQGFKHFIRKRGDDKPIEMNKIPEED